MRLCLKIVPSVLPTRGYNGRSLGHIPRGSATAHSFYFTPSLWKTQKVHLLQEPLAFPGAQPPRKAPESWREAAGGGAEGGLSCSLAQPRASLSQDCHCKCPLLFNAHSPPTQDQSNGAGCC